MKINKISDKQKIVVEIMEEKLCAINQLQSGIMARTIVLELRVYANTLGDWKKNRAEIGHGKKFKT